MFIDFDVHEESNAISILESLQEGTKRISLFDLITKRTIREVSNEYQPFGTRLSPNGKRLAFSSLSNPLYVYDLEIDKVKTIFDNPLLHTGFCEWSSDGKQLCFSAHSTDSIKKMPPDIYFVNVENLQVEQLTNSEGVDRFPQWSPNNQFIAFHRQYLHESNAPKKIYIVDTSIKECYTIPLSDESNHQIGRYCWSKNSSHILVKEFRNDEVHLKVIRISNMEIEWTFTYPEIEGGAFLSDNENILVICKKEILIVSFLEGHILKKHRLPECIELQETLRGPSISLSSTSNNIYFLNENSCIYRMSIEGTFELLLQEPKEEIPVFTHQEYIINSRDGKFIPVHRYIPENPKKMGILLACGGPGERVDDPRDSLVSRFLKEGYEVIVPAYRGCSGYGIEYKNANRGEYGRADVWDVIDVGFDWKTKTDNICPLAIIGFSYGGYLTFLSMSNQNVPWDCGLTLWGVTKIENLPLHFLKAYPTDELERRIAEKERNPLEQAYRIKKPLLILHGGKDQSSTNEEVKLIQEKIQSHGGVCKLVIYEDGTHGLGKQRPEMFQEIFSFLEKINIEINDRIFGLLCNRK